MIRHKPTFNKLHLAIGLFASGGLSSAQADDAQNLRAAEAPAGAIWLESLQLGKMSSSYERPRIGRSIENHPLSLHGAVYPHGVGTHAVSQFALDLNGAERFVSAVGVDDDTEGKGTVSFEVFVDGKLVAETGIMKGGDAPKVLSVDLRGAKRLVLHVGDGEDGIDHDHADWAGAHLIMAANASAPQAVEISDIRPPVDDETPMPIFSYARVSAMPAIHGPRIVGTTPNRPFLFLIPATGQGPLRYAAKKLPAGLTLDANTGIISGALTAAGMTTVQLEVRGPRGVARRNLSIVGGPNKLALTPPMGWNSWNIYYCGVDEKKVRDATDWITKTALDKHGYQFVNIDDCWQAPRKADGEIGVNEKFGDLKVLGDYIHARGLKFGIYSSPGPKTCAGYEASYNHELQDAQSYAKWGVDYLKHDWCSYGGVATGEGREKFKKPYRTMRGALDMVNRDIVYSLCQYGMDNVWEWGADADIKANLWRTTGDIGPNYSSMAGIGFNQAGHEKYAGPGHWNDPDMLFVHALKPNEQVTHITLWSLLAAPLLIGSDISKLPQYSLDVLSNDEVIEIDQDPLGRAASRVRKDGAIEVWSRPLWDGTRAVGLFNRGRTKTNVSATWAELGLKGTQPVRDVWQHKDLGRVKNAFAATVPAHGAVLLKIGKPNATDFVPMKAF